MKSLEDVGTQVRLKMPLQRVDAAPPPSDQLPRVPRRARPAAERTGDRRSPGQPATDGAAARLPGPAACQRPAMAGKAWPAWRAGDFDVLVLHCNMPHMNGYQLATAVRAEERHGKRPRCTILGYTANAQPEVRRKVPDRRHGRLPAQADQPEYPQPVPGEHSPAPPAIAPRASCTNWTAWRPWSGHDPARPPALPAGPAAEPAGRPGQLDGAAPWSTTATPLPSQAHKVLSAARMLEAPALMAACEALEAGTCPLPRCACGARHWHAHMRRVERALARELATSAAAQAGSQTC